MPGRVSTSINEIAVTGAAFVGGPAGRPSCHARVRARLAIALPMSRICLIHAVKVAIAPVEAAFARLWPQASLMNLLDDSLSLDRQRDGELTSAMMERFRVLGAYAVETGADGILFTCSAFGPAIEAVAHRLPVPVLKPNEAMFAEAFAAGARLGLLASFEPSIAPMSEEFAAMARARSSNATLVTACAPEAMAALNRGDGEAHDHLLAEAAGALAQCDAIMLAQFSTARARTAVEAATGARVLTSPDAAVRAMRAALDA